MPARDARGRLITDPFDHRSTKDGRVFVSRGGRPVATIAGHAAERLLREIDRATDAQAVQQLLARATGKYRHGDEHGGRRSRG